MLEKKGMLEVKGMLEEKGMLVAGGGGECCKLVRGNVGRGTWRS